MVAIVFYWSQLTLALEPEHQTDSVTRGTFSFDPSRGIITVGFHKLPTFTEGMIGSIHIITTDDQGYCTQKYALDPSTRCDTGGVLVTNGADGLFSSQEAPLKSSGVHPWFSNIR